jgi:hypothetical protein
MSEKKVTPLIGPLMGLLRSRKFLVSVVTLVIDLIIAYLPAAEPVRAELLTVFTFVGMWLVGAIAAEDMAKKGNPGG